ncbi:glycosyltransferase family 4 protein [bacterium]|nr:glycosyltransferase family 4 protein [bacterium]
MKKQTIEKSILEIMDSKFKIAIDMRGTQTYSLHRGIGTLWREIMIRLAKIDSENNYLLIYAKDFPASDDEVLYPENFHKIYINVPFFRKKLSLSYLWTLDNFVLERVVKKFGADVLMHTTFAELWFKSKKIKGIPTVMWVYDMIPFIFSRTYFDKAKYGRLKKIFMKKKLKFAEKLDLIITISVAGKVDFLRFVPSYPEDKVIVDYLGVNPEFENVPKLLVDNTIKKFALTPNYIFYLGGIDPRKNLHRAIEAYSIALKMRANLPDIVIAGKMDEKHKDYVSLMQKIDELGLDERVKFIGFVPDDLLPALYFAASFLLFPSLCEGFGLPVAEAMTAGCPVLTSNLSSMPEVAGKCALFIDPHSTKSIADGIVKMCSDNELREKLKKCGKIQAQNFNWEHTAKNLIDIVERMVK